MKKNKELNEMIQRYREFTTSIKESKYAGEELPSKSLHQLPHCSFGSNSEIYFGNNMDVLKLLPDNFLDGNVTDGPYGIQFLSNNWDSEVPSVEFWEEVYRVLKPGAFVVSFGSPRTNHKMVTNIENAGFNIQGQINWIYSSGMPKSTNLSLKIDKHLGHPNRGHQVATASRNHPNGKKLPNGVKLPPYQAITEEAKKWSGYGTAGLKPAFEPITIAQKPISEKNIAANVLKWGTGGINVDACRIDKRFPADIILECICDHMSLEETKKGKTNHIIVKHTDPDCPCFQMDVQSGLTDQGFWQNSNPPGKIKVESGQSMDTKGFNKYKILAGASSYFRVIYNSKASKQEKERGLAKNGQRKKRQNQHPTVKPIALMKELIQLFIPEGGKFIDPYIGSGSSGIACLALGNRNFIGVELDKMYYDTAVNRCNYEVVLKNQN